MTVRIATMDDMTEIVWKGARFCAAAGYTSFVPEDAEEFAAGLIRSGAIFLSKGGVLGAALAQVPWDRSHHQAVELFWWSEDGHGMALFRAFERWASDKAHSIVFATIDLDPRADKIMRARGWRVREKSWIKEAA